MDVILLVITSIVLILSKKKLRFSLVEMLCLVLSVLVIIINFKYKLNIFNQGVGLVLLGAVFTPPTVLGFWYYLANKENDPLVQWVSTIALYVVLISSRLIFIINLILLIVIAIYAFKYYRKKVEFLKRLAWFAIGFGSISIFWFLKSSNGDAKAFFEGNGVYGFDINTMPLSIIVFPFNIFSLACLARKEKLRHNAIILIFSGFYILISFIIYMYKPMFNGFVSLSEKFGAFEWIKIFFSLFAVMGILRFNRLINREHTKRMSVSVLILIIPLLFFNFKYLKAFYVDVLNNSRELAFKVRRIDGISLEDKKSEIRVVFGDKKKEIEKNVLKKNASDSQINDFILNNSIAEEEVVYSSDGFLVLVDDSLFRADLDSNYKSEKILEETKMPIILLRSKEILGNEDIGFDFDYILLGDIENMNKNKIEEKYSDKLIDLKDIKNLNGEYINFNKLDYDLVDKNDIQIMGVKDNRPIILNYKYDRNWRAYQDGKSLDKYFVLPDKMMFLPKSESNIKISKINNALKWSVLSGIIGLFVFGLIVWKIKQNR